MLSSVLQSKLILSGSQEFEAKARMHQGPVLLLLLFAFMVDVVIEECAM